MQRITIILVAIAIAVTAYLLLRDSPVQDPATVLAQIGDEQITVAEFVEDEDSFQLLRQYGVDSCQGYLLGKPQLNRPVRNTKSGIANKTPNVTKFMR